MHRQMLSKIASKVIDGTDWGVAKRRPFADSGLPANRWLRKVRVVADPEGGNSE
jgi:hypothetical protein